MGISKYKLDEMLISAKYITKGDNGYTLTKLGIEKSGTIKKHAKYGEYIAWDENIEIPNKTTDQGKEFFSATKIATKYNLTSRKINMTWIHIISEYP